MVHLKETIRQDVVRLGAAGRGTAWYGAARHGTAWFGKGANGTKETTMKDVAVEQSGKVKFFHGRSTQRETTAVLDLIRERTYGDLLTYDELEALIGDKRNDGHRFRTVMLRVKGLALKEQHVALKAVQNEGYIILKPLEQINEAVRIARSGAKKLGRATVMAQCINHAKLTEVDHKYADFVAVRLQDLYGGLRRETLVLGKMSSTKSLPWNSDNGFKRPNEE